MACCSLMPGAFFVCVLAWPALGSQVRIPVIPATQSSAKLPRNPEETWFLATFSEH
jgi:hypothetical protein